MRKKLFVILSLAVALVVASCSKATYLKVDEKGINLGKEGGKGSLHLRSDGTSFEISYAPEWAQVCLLDSTVVYFATENTDKAFREDSIVITCNDFSVCVNITQAYICTYIKSDCKEITFEKEGGKKDIKIDTDGGALKVDAPEGATAKYEGGRLYVEVNKTDGTGVKRDIFLSYDDQKLVIPLVQKGNFCASCQGTGYTKCPRCNGTGMWEHKRCEDMDDWHSHNCETCGGADGGPVMTSSLATLHGSGRVKCKTCGGTGK